MFGCWHFLRRATYPWMISPSLVSCASLDSMINWIPKKIERGDFQDVSSMIFPSTISRFQLFGCPGRIPGGEASRQIPEIRFHPQLPIVSVYMGVSEHGGPQ